MPRGAWTHCTACRNPLPCRLIPEDRANRCAACLRLAWDARKQHGRPPELPPGEQEKVERRIEMYAGLAEARQPLFNKEAM